MLHSLLASSYRTYKEDTDTVATWLALTAKQCGINVDSAEIHADQVKPAPRLKGRARKLARENGDRIANELKSTPSKYVLQVKDFTRLAEAISKTDHSVVTVPRKIVKALNRAIKLREDYSAAHKISGKGLESTDFKADVGHSYFLEILRKTRDILVLCKPIETFVDDVCEPSEDSEGVAEIQPSFDEANISDIEEILKEFGQIETQDTETCLQYTSERVTDPAEQITAVNCLLTDVRSIRQMVHQHWRIYKKKTGIVPIAISVNMAIEIVRDIERDFHERFPDKLDYGAILDSLPGLQCFNGDQKCCATEAPYGAGINVNEQQGDDLMFHTYLCCRNISRRITTKNFSVLTPGTYKPRDRSTKWFEKSWRERMADDNIVLHEMIPDLCMLSICEPGNFAEDELLRGWRDLKRDQPIPLWFVFSVQCFLDAQHILEEETANAFIEFQKSATATKGTILKVLELHEAMRPKVSRALKMTDLPLRELLMAIEGNAFTDPLLPQLLKIKTNGPPLTPEPFRLLKQHPLLCGLQLYAMKISTQSMSLHYANLWGTVVPTMHLYNALRQEGLLTRTWHDIEVIMNRQGTRRLFVGDLPKERDQYIKRFLLASGCSATLMAKNSRKKIDIRSSKGPRPLQAKCPLTRAFLERYFLNGQVVNWDCKKLPQVIIAKTDKSKETTDGEDLTTSYENRAKQFFVDSITAIDQKPGECKIIELGREKRSIPLHDFFTYLIFILKDETLDFSFDYLAVHRSCLTVINKMEENCSGELRQLYGKKYPEYSTSREVLFLLGTVSGHFVSDSPLKIKELVAAGDKVLRKAGTIFQEMLQSDVLEELAKSMVAAGILWEPGEEIDFRTEMFFHMLERADLMRKKEVEGTTVDKKGESGPL